MSRKTEYALIALARLAAQQPTVQAKTQVREPSGLEDMPKGERGQDSDTMTRPAMSARTLAAADKLPTALLSGVLKQLQQAGLIASRRGSRGGYYLPDGPEAIRIADVIAAIEGPEPVRLTPCCEQDEPSHTHHGAHRPNAKDGADEGEDEDEEGCSIMCRCPITGAIRGLNRRMHGFLEQFTLAHLLESEKTEDESPKTENRKAGEQ